ncbi:MAG: hypothetical protein OXS40_11045, partial [Gammaproteobacteria bacterium]|nr:hypothetical protein [Gammaproteobacteria bacterium]
LWGASSGLEGGGGATGQDAGKERRGQILTILPAQGEKKNQEEEERAIKGRGKGMLRNNSESVITHKNPPILGCFRRNPSMGRRDSVHGSGKSGKNIPFRGRMIPGSANEITNLQIALQGLDCAGVGIYSLRLINVFIAHKKTNLDGITSCFCWNIFFLLFPSFLASSYPENIFGGSISTAERGRSHPLNGFLNHP